MRKLVSCLLWVLVLLFVVGCSSGPPPDKVASDFIDAMIKGDFETARKLAGGKNVEGEVIKSADTTNSEQGKRLAKSILSRVTYQLGEKKIEGDKAEVGMKITAPDLMRIASKAMSEAFPLALGMSKEEADAYFQQYFENAINDPNAPMTTSEVKIILERKDGSWSVQPNEELLNALTGNIMKASKKPAADLTEHRVGQPFTVASLKLNPNAGQPDLTGNITVTIEKYEFSASIKDAFTGQGNIKPRGRFLIVYYSVTNHLNVEMQPATQISDELYITDAQGRRWETIDYTGNYGAVSGSAAVAKGYRQPEESVQPGFKNTTAVVFDIPQDVKNGLALVWEEAAVRVALQ